MTIPFELLPVMSVSCSVLHVVGPYKLLLNAVTVAISSCNGFFCGIFRLLALEEWCRDSGTCEQYTRTFALQCLRYCNI